MKYFITFFILCTFSLFAQVTIVSTFPANNSTDVPLSTTISLVFSTPVDTSSLKNQEYIFSNINSPDVYFSANAETLFASVQLDSNTAYFVAILFARGLDGSTLTVPQVFYFTTGSSFPSTTVSGTVLSGSTGVTPENAIVALSKGSLESQEEGPPPFAAWANVNNDGTFTIPYVLDGTYWPIAVKDVNNDGNLNGNYPDVFAFGDSIIVSGNYTGLELTFERPEPISVADALHLADSIRQHDVASVTELKQIQAYNVDTMGHVMDWQFYYTSNDSMLGYDIHVGFGAHEYNKIDDMNFLTWLTYFSKTIPNTDQIAELETVISNVENNGGKDFRKQFKPTFGETEFRIEANLRDQSHSQYMGIVPDTNKAYWGVYYTVGYDTDTMWVASHELYFLCDASTGAVIGSVMSAGKRTEQAPSGFVLRQNYPNPFNPATILEFSIPKEAWTTLKIYNIIGQEVATLVNQELKGGTLHRAVFNAAGMPSGIYFAQLRSGGQMQVTKMLLMK